MARLPDTIQTKRLQLSVPEVSDGEEIFKSYASDKRVTVYMTWKPHTTVADTREFLSDTIAEWEKNISYSYKVVHISTGRIIGMVKIVITSKKSAMVGYVFAYNEWNRGYATELLHTIIQTLFCSSDIYEVSATCDVENKASERVMKKAGMKFVKILPKYVIHPNISPNPRDVCLYVVSKKRRRTRQKYEDKYAKISY